MTEKIIVWLILWYVLGIIGNFIGLVFYQGRVSVKDVIAAIPLSLLGAIMLVMGIYYALDNYGFFDEILWEKKDK